MPIAAAVVRFLQQSIRDYGGMSAYPHLFRSRLLVCLYDTVHPVELLLKLQLLSARVGMLRQ